MLTIMSEPELATLTKKTIVSGDCPPLPIDIEALAPGKTRVAPCTYIDVWPCRDGTYRRRWLYRYMLRGAARHIDLGAYPEVSVNDAIARGAVLHDATKRLRRGEPIAAELRYFFG